MSWRKGRINVIYFVTEVCQLCSFSPYREKKKKTRHLQDDHDTHKQKRRLPFCRAHLDFPQIKHPECDLSWKRFVHRQCRHSCQEARVGGGDGDGEAVGDESCERICWVYRVPLLLRFRRVVVRCLVVFEDVISHLIFIQRAGWEGAGPCSPGLPHPTHIRVRQALL